MTNLRRIGTVAAALAFSVAPALARLDVTLDADTLNDLLANMAPDHAEVALTAGKKLTIQMKDMKVTGFDPTAGPNGGLATSLRLIVPDLSIDTPVAPHLLGQPLEVLVPLRRIGEQVRGALQRHCPERAQPPPHPHPETGRGRRQTEEQEEELVLAHGVRVTRGRAA